MGFVTAASVETEPPNGTQLSTKGYALNARKWRLQLMEDEKRISDLLEIVERYVVSSQSEYVAIIVKIAFNRGMQDGIRWSLNDISRRPH